MKKFTKVLAVLLAVAVFATAFAACSKNGGTSSKVKVIDIALSDEEYAFGVDKTSPNSSSRLMISLLKSNQTASSMRFATSISQTALRRA